MLEFCYGVAIILGAIAAFMFGFGILALSGTAYLFVVGMTQDGEDVHVPRFTMTHHYVLHMDDGSTYEVDEN